MNNIKGKFVDYSDKEVELAFKYLFGEINDIQLNFLAVQNNIDENRIIEICKKLRFSEKIFKLSVYAIIFLIVYFYFYILWRLL